MGVHRAALVLVATLTTAAPSAGEDEARANIGDVVRISLEGTDSSVGCVRCITGTLMSLDANNLTMAVPGEPSSRTLPLETVAGIEVRRGRTRLRGAGMGAVGGLALAGVLFTGCFNAQTPEDPEERSAICREPTFSRIFVGTTIVGGLIGLIVSGERWYEVPERGWHVGVVPVHGVGMGLRVAFTF